ncbi:MAG: transcription factor S [Candidatus Thermoplasmatota archaeon]|nr:transcription factor S [Euryarchaeota archaeon]MBU4071291.1 transcription factor S [Candidatus Thermoplasmatota archaeon]MBU4145208.1 transcription factor S [Candidatus Thermoplasmatota archaeon]MBU4592193.1 transcription factor S [Candidatus Thermoplasmatota archaeon]
MPMFCKKCKSLMSPFEGKWKCKSCGYLCNSTGSNSIMTERNQDREILILNETNDTMPKTKAECPKCGHNEAFFILRQTRAADEPETRIYRCVKCSHSWREY